MPTHSSQVRVNIYDLDAYGELRPHVVLRLLQQAASDASAAVGFDVEWYERTGTLWVIRRTIADYVAPAFYRDVLEIRTWVSDLRRVRSQREYEVRRVGDRRLIARASTDWVYVDLARGAPTRPPEEMQRRLLPDVGALSRPPRAAAEAPAHAVRTSRGVEFGDVDSVAHVNNAHYALYVEQAVYDALGVRGWRLDPLERAARLRVARLDLEYFAEAQYGDQLDATVWTTGPDGAAFGSLCTLSRGETRVLHAASQWTWSAAELPPALRAAVTALSV